jgi:hypothetical protein
MKIISCSNCATLLDTDRLYLDKPWLEDGTANKHMAWDGGDMVPTIKCPVCDTKINWSNGDLI